MVVLFIAEVIRVQELPVKEVDTFEWLHGIDRSKQVIDMWDLISDTGHQFRSHPQASQNPIMVPSMLSTYATPARPDNGEARGLCLML
jgi:hypothetical protein